jgi:general secretion pathway protein G
MFFTGWPETIMVISPRTFKKSFLSIFIEEIRPVTTFGPKKPKGFTIIEIIIVIAILGTLAGIALPIFANYLDGVKVTRAIADIKVIEKEILAFSVDNERFPENLAEIGLDNILDPYGNPYQYQPSTYIDKKGNVKKAAHRRKDHNLVPVNTDFDLFSMGKDGDSVDPFTAKASRDDIVRANNGMFIGPVSAY